MRSFKLFWTAHKWTGFALSAILVCTATTGLLLLLKKQFDWIQPPTRQGAPGEVADFITIDDALAAAFASGNESFRSFDDIDRIDVRPAKRVYKIRSRHHAEIQVCAVSGQVLAVETRRSDLIEQIHDGSFVAGWFHDWVMPVFSGGMLFLVGSGLWLWIEPKVRRHRRRLGRSRR
ncbi:MAG: PepSY domain-containing protein [Planctomycetes bacterium]|nr:PepSY domain-containing protein [Planctomycetota bacterium]